MPVWKRQLSPSHVSGEKPPVQGTDECVQLPGTRGVMKKGPDGCGGTEEGPNLVCLGLEKAPWRG